MLQVALTKSSMLPYMVFFMPEARVATHPPRELNSMESGSCPVQKPRSPSCRTINQVYMLQHWLDLCYDNTLCIPIVNTFLFP